MTNQKHNLIGAAYPIKDEIGKVIGFRNVVSQQILSNYTGYVIFLEPDYTGEEVKYGLPILVSFQEAELYHTTTLSVLQKIYEKGEL